MAKADIVLCFADTTSGNEVDDVDSHTLSHVNGQSLTNTKNTATAQSFDYNVPDVGVNKVGLYDVYVRDEDSTGEHLPEARTGTTYDILILDKVPTDPGNFSTTSGGYSGDKAIVWGASTYAAKYKVYRATSEGGSYSHISTPTSATHTITADANNTLDFWYKVLAQNDNAILQGGGDPDLTVKDLDSLAYAVSKKVDSIDTLFLDDTFLDSVYFGNGWMWDEGPWWYAAPISALSVNDNCIDFYVQPGKEDQNAIINYFPNTKYISFQNQSLTVKRNTNLKKLKIDRDWSDKKNNFSVTGEIFYKEELDTLRRNIHDPTMFTGVLFKEMLEKHGLEINYVMKKKVSRNTDTLATHKSLPLIKSASNLMNESDNLTAELFIKTIGRNNITQGNWKSGLDSVNSL